MSTGPNTRYRLAAAMLSVALAASGCLVGDPPAGEPLTVQKDSPPADDEVIRASGIVVQGVRPECLLLDDGITRYLLLGGDRDKIEPGRQLTVTGYADLETASTTPCVEGIPLEVAEIRPAG